VGCETNNDCPHLAPACIDGICTEEVPIGCIRDVDCGSPAVYICFAGICRTRTKIPIKPIPQCLNSFFCPPPLVCLDGVCTKKPRGYCELSENCQTKKMVCYKSTCHEGLPTGCLVDMDCTLDYPVCVQGLCMKRRPRVCNTNVDCFASLPFCFNRICTNVMPVCTEDEDCPREADKCKNGVCESSHTHIRPKPPGCVKVRAGSRAGGIIIIQAQSLHRFFEFLQRCQLRMMRFINHLFKNVASTVLVHRIIFYFNENL
jgi:hypothetical protein